MMEIHSIANGSEAIVENGLEDFTHVTIYKYNLIMVTLAHGPHAL
jgi:hypothetical protein